MNRQLLFIAVAISFSALTARSGSNRNQHIINKTEDTAIEVHFHDKDDHQLYSIILEAGQEQDVPVKSFSKISVRGKSGLGKRVEQALSAKDTKWFSSIWNGAHVIEISIVDEEALHKREQNIWQQPNNPSAIQELIDSIRFDIKVKSA
jgi:hypothetical protein